MIYFNFYATSYEFFSKIKSSLKDIWNYYPNRLYLLFILIFQSLAWFQAVFIKNSLSGDLLVLRYKIDFGANLIGKPSSIIYFPLISLLVFLFNFIFLMFLTKEKRFNFLSQLILSGILIFSVFLCLYLFSVYLVNFR